MDANTAGLVGALIGLVAGLLIGGFCALRFDDWLKGKRKRIRCDLGAPIERDTFDDTDEEPSMRRLTKDQGGFGWQPRPSGIRDPQPPRSPSGAVPYATPPLRTDGTSEPAMMRAAEARDERVPHLRFAGHPNGGSVTT